MALPNARVALTDGGASGDAAGIFDDEPMCIATTVPVSAHAAKNGSQYPLWIVGRPRWYGSSLKQTAAHAPCRVAPDLVDGGVDVPERDDGERDEAPTRVAAPLLDHPVVVGLDAGQPELLVGAFEERLAAEPRQGREAHRRFDPAHVHVGETRHRVVATRAHVVVGDRRERHLLFRVPDGRDHPLVRVHEVFVEPAVDLRGRVVVEVLDVAGGTDVVDLADTAPHDLGAAVAVLRRQPALPDVRGLDHVVVDADELRDLPHDRWWLRSAARAFSTLTMSSPLSARARLDRSPSRRGSRAAAAPLSFHVSDVGVVISSRTPFGSWK